MGTEVDPLVLTGTRKTQFMENVCQDNIVWQVSYYPYSESDAYINPKVSHWMDLASYLAVHN